MSVCSASNLPKYPRDTDPIHKISAAMRAAVSKSVTALFTTLAISLDLD